jgi:DNA-binding PadR family transcriptional regulator
MVLFLLKKGSLSLTNAQISDFFIEKGYTNYFTLQQVIHSLLESEMITAETTRNTTRYNLTSQGEETLSYLKDKLSQGIIQDILSYLNDRKIEMVNELSVLSDYDRSANGEYAVHFRIVEKETTVIDLTLSVVTEALAERMCDNWQKHSSEMYGYLMERLLK